MEVYKVVKVKLDGSPPCPQRFSVSTWGQHEHRYPLGKDVYFPKMYGIAFFDASLACDFACGLSEMLNDYISIRGFDERSIRAYEVWIADADTVGLIDWIISPPMVRDIGPQDTCQWPDIDDFWATRAWQDATRLMPFAYRTPAPPGSVACSRIRLEWLKGSYDIEPYVEYTLDSPKEIEDAKV